jgi:predicted transcriptional regulator
MCLLCVFYVSLNVLCKCDIESEGTQMATRAHIVLPEDLLQEVDRVAGKRKRSRFIEEAIRDKLSREALRLAMDKARGILNLEDYPEWSTPEKISAWVHDLRQADNERLARKWAGREEE